MRFVFAAKQVEFLKGSADKALMASAFLSLLVAASTIFSVVAVSNSRFREKSLDPKIEKRFSDIEAFANSIAEVNQREFYTAGVLEKKRIEEIEKKQETLESALGNETDKVVSLAMLRRDIDEAKSVSEKRINFLESRIESLNTLLLSIAGLMVTILLGFLGLLGLRKSPSQPS